MEINEVAPTTSEDNIRIPKWELLSSDRRIDDSSANFYEFYEKRSLVSRECNQFDNVVP